MASEATPWVKCAVELAPAKGKSVETECVMFTFALAGRGVIGCGGFLRVSLRLPWAEEVIGLSARLGWWGLYATIYFSAHLGCQGQGECHTLLICEKSVEIREICGRQLSAQCAKEQAGCIYSPTDLSDKHRCHAGCLSITQIAPSARQIDTDFSHAESNMYGSMPHDGACLIRGRSV